MAKRKRVGVLISGRGSNMEALLEACDRPDFPAEIVVVVSNRPDAGGLAKAEARGITAKVIDHTAFDDRPDFEDALTAVLQEHSVDLICNAGFMRLLTEHFVSIWKDRLLNIHPSLLPAFRGLHTHERAIQSGAKISGCTVHFVRVEMDAGPIVIQGAVPILANDTPDTLAARILKTEHDIYPRALEMVASGRVRVVGDRVVGFDGDVSVEPLIAPTFPSDP